MKSVLFGICTALSLMNRICWLDETADVFASNISNNSHLGYFSSDDYYDNASVVYNLIKIPKDNFERVSTKTNIRLPRNLLPYHYNLTLKPIITSEPPFRYWGRVHIHFQCIQRTNILIIHGLYSPIWSSVNISFDRDYETSLPEPIVDSYVLNKSDELLLFNMRNDFVAGRRYTFRADFTRRMSYNGKGFYWASYIDRNNVTRYVASTHFQPVEARRVFPCFDEINMKATFNISVIRQADHISLSNMPKMKTLQLSDEWFEDYFDTTPRMSTYLLCVMVGDFVRVPAVNVPKINMSVSLYAVDSQTRHLRYVSEHVHSLIMWFYRNIFHAYIEPKLDHVSVPFRASAMENWGLISYSEDILCISNETSVAGKIRALTIVSHEIAHMRFGNLVTCEWWGDLWIQEGIATYFNFLPMEALNTDGSQIQQGRFLEGIQKIMNIDQKNVTSYIKKIIINPIDAFNVIVYYKTAAVMRHVQGILTQPVFFRVLERFLKKNAFDNAESQDFVDALNEQVLHENITHPDGSLMDFDIILNPWLTQIGFPLVTTERINDSFILASQSHYLNPRNQTLNLTVNQSWKIPLTLVGAESHPRSWKAFPTHWIDIDETSTIINISIVGGNWYVLNPNQYFYFRVLYDEDDRKNLVRQLCLNHTAIPVETRAQLIDDVFDLARNSYLSITDALEFTKYLRNEVDYNPWEATLHHMNYVALFFENEYFFDQLQTYLKTLLDHVLDDLGYEFIEDEPVFRSLLRSVSISAACSFGSTKCLDHIHSLYKLYIADADINSVDSNVLATVLCWGVFEGTSRDWEIIYDQYHKRKNSLVRNERSAYLQALICTTNTTLLDKIYDDYFKGNIKQHSVLTSSKYLSEKVWQFWKTSNLSNARKFKQFEGVIEKWYLEEQLEELKEIQSNVFYIEQLIIQSILQVEANMEFRRNNIEPLRRWLNDNVENIGDPSIVDPEVMSDDPGSNGKSIFHPSQMILFHYHLDDDDDDDDDNDLFKR